MEIRSLKEEIDKQENSVYLYNDERRRINVLWIYAQKEMEDKQAELRNKEREF
jgi:Ser/Thr protein kinase RdoA (MazF antagonist)